MLKNTESYKSLKEFIDSIAIIDCHEHTGWEKDFLKSKSDFFNVMPQYSASDFDNAGNAFERPAAKAGNTSLSIEERWEAFKPLYERCKNTGYLQAMRLACRALFGVEPDGPESIARINEGIAKHQKPGMIEYLLRERANIDKAIVVRQYGAEPDPPFLKHIINIDDQIRFGVYTTLESMRKETGVRVHRVEHLSEHYRKWIDLCEEGGAIGFKSPIAYQRPIHFPKPPRDEAQAALQRMIDFTKAPWMPGEAISLREAEPLTNYAMHLFLEALEEKNLPISFHTGIQARGMNDIRWTNPQHLINLFNEYPNVRFDLFHGGFPYGHEWIELAKSWPNVYLNFCWVNSISPHVARQLLAEAIECVPINKIFAHGGDVGRPEIAVGMAMQSRENVALVLAEKVELGIFPLEEAKEYAERVLRTNALEMWNMG